MTVDEMAKAYCCKASNDEGCGFACHAEGCDVQAAYKAGYEAGYEQGTGRPYAGKEIEVLTKEEIDVLTKENAELKKQIKKMKCCGNCKYICETRSPIDYKTTYLCKKGGFSNGLCSEWEGAE